MAQRRWWEGGEDDDERHTHLISKWIAGQSILEESGEITLHSIPDTEDRASLCGL